MRIAVAIQAYLKVLWLLANGNLTFMHVHAAMRGSFWRKSLFAATARQFGVPSIMHLHGSEMESFFEGLSRSRQNAVTRSLERAAAVIVLSESWRVFVAKIAPRARIHVINNYVTLPSDYSINHDSIEFNVLFLGVLGRRKGIYDLLECWPAVVKAVPNARLLIGGNGEIQASMARAVALGITGSVEFLGWIDGAQKADLLKRADAFVLPSYNEGLPMSVLEAMACGKPVLTTNVGGIPELITHLKDGLLVNPGDQTALTEELVALGVDPALRRKLGFAARARIQGNFSDDAVLPRLEGLYAELTERSAAN